MVVDVVVEEEADALLLTFFYLSLVCWVNRDDCQTIFQDWSNEGGVCFDCLV